MPTLSSQIAFPLTNLFNPKAAVLYLSLLPQFIHPWLAVRRWPMGTVLAGLAIRMATDARR